MKNNFENTIAKVFAGEASRKEIGLVGKWKNEKPAEYDKYQRAFSADIFESRDFDDGIFKDITSRLSALQKKSWINQNSLVFKIAAIFVGLALIGSLFLYNKSLNVTYFNDGRELANVTLPDGSQITLACNSSIQYKKSWLGNFNRNVELEGKAYFEITKDVAHAFIVNTSKMDVTVLGTKFTVNELTTKTQVVLIEGKVELSGSAIKENLIIDKPGSQVIVDNNEILANDVIDQNLYASWLNNKIHFNNCTVSQVIDMLYNSYDMDVVLDNPELLDKKLFGSAPSDDPGLIVDALSYILNTKLVTVEHRK